MDFLEVCRRLISIDTSPVAGTLDAAEFLAQTARSLGLVPQVYPDTHLGVDQANLVVRSTDWSNEYAQSSDKELVLQTHIDTPDPGSYSLWLETGLNPFQATIRNGELYGLGAADCKLDFVCKLFALAQSPTGSSRRVACAATFGEETGMLGAVRLMRKKAIRPLGVLVGEPTDFKLVYAAKGYASVQIDIPFSEIERDYRDAHDRGEQTSSQSRAFIGKAAHSSDPAAGDNAIAKMLTALARLPSGLIVLDADGGHNPNTVPAHAFIEIDPFAGAVEPAAESQFMRNKLVHIHKAIQQLEMQFALVQDDRFHPSSATLNLGTIRTGQSSVRLAGCVRLPARIKETQFNNWIEQFRIECEKIEARLLVDDYKPPFETRLEASQLGDLMTQACQSEQLPQSLGVLSVTNESSIFSRFGVPCLVWGPGQGVGNSHTPAEYVRLKDLEKATAVYRTLIASFSST